MQTTERPLALLINNDARHFVQARLAQARALEARGFAIELAVPESDVNSLPFRSPADAEWFRCLRKHPYQLSRMGVNPLMELRSIRCLAQIVRARRPLIVHGVTPKGSIYASIAARSTPEARGLISTITGLGFAFSSHSKKARLLRPVIKRAYKAAFSDPRARVIFQNPDDRELFLRLKILRADQTRLIAGSGVDVEHFSFSPEPDGPIKIVYIGRMLRDKGVATLIDAVRLARVEIPTLELHLAGDIDAGNPESFRREEVDAWRASDDIIWHGPIADVRPLLALASIVCLLSRREGTPMSLLEAAACGRALIATDAPGCREAVVDGQTGLLVPVDDAQAVAKAILSLARNNDLRRRMGQAARARAVRVFSKDAIADDIAALYRECLGDNGGPS